LIAALILGVVACPREIGYEERVFTFAPLASVVSYETFDSLGEGVLQIDGNGSPLDNANGAFKVNLAVSTGEAALSVVKEQGRGNVLKIAHTGDAGGGLITDFAFVPTAEAYGAMQGKRVILQYLVRLENTNNFYGVGPYVYHGRGTPGVGAALTFSGNQSVHSRIYGNGTFQWESSITNTWQTSPVTQNEWHAVEFLVDFYSHRYQCYVDGSKLVEEPFFNQASAAFGAVRFYINSYETALFLDDIRISTDSKTGPFAPAALPADCGGGCECYGLYDCGIPGCACAPPPSLVELADQDFEAYTAGESFSDGGTISITTSDPAYDSTFTVGLGTGAAASVVEEGGGKVLKLTAGSGSGGDAVFTYDTTNAIEAAAAGKKVIISYRIKHDGTGTVSAPSVYYPGSSDASVTNELSDGRFRYYPSGGNGAQSIPAASNEWHEAAIVIDYSQKTYMFILDGEEIIEFGWFRQEGTGFGKVSFSIEGDTTPGTFWLDDIRIGCYDPEA
jgi:hypothetical protein